MDVESVCVPLIAESDVEKNSTSANNVASVTAADKVINTQIDNTQVEGGKSEEELLKSLLTDDYCHVCEAVLLFESQRLSHYEGKKHAQKLRVYLQAVRAEKLNTQFAVLQPTITTDKDRFCELCKMVFSSPVVARSHYEGKVHAKNLGKKGLQPTDKYKEKTLQSLTQDSENADHKLTADGEMGPTATTTSTTPSTEVDLKDPNKYCALCTASFNNPQMALQHYNGRKHQRNQARQELLKELGDNVQQVLGSSPFLSEESLTFRYAVIHSNQTFDCDSHSSSCDLVYWFRSNPDDGNVQYIGNCNNANRAVYESGFKTRFTISKRSSTSFSLRIAYVTKEDTGIYSCVLMDKKNTEIWKPGFLLLPGVEPPTEPPKIEPKQPVKPVCHCSNSSQDGCGSLILWPLVGIIGALALALICILYYFSRLPKKCRHHFVKKR
ncbi:zinc finger matrin-type protein 1 isoform X2 [Cheilinus undulatus]|uniref:zinc finger matrin-type protein 1 isoform X2 n=1 Tax=Cheilinus undulatus TaxID=241271 RepID=UPI001BD6C58A|nr:zinc finger matrin-type protein 1 isoform X2 [Cheilinus undulatus]